MKKKVFLHSLTRSALIAAMYAALTLLASLFGLAFGPIQVRVSEALTILPVFSAASIPALSVGCLLANLIGLFTGNPLGWMDMIFGTAATLIAAVLTYLLRNIRWRNLPVLASLPPVICNAVIVGLELTFALHGSFLPGMFGWYALTVGAGQAVACIGLGLPLYAVLRKHKLDRFFR